MTDTIRTEKLFGRKIQWSRFAADLRVTLILWAYFTLGFLVCFAPFYLLAMVLPPYRVRMIRAVNHYFYRGFFRLCRLLIPTLHWRIDPAVADLRSMVVVCNHLSYIDSILLISLLKNHTTIVKERLFHIPILNWVLKLSGYLPSASGGAFSEMLVRRMGNLCRDLSRGVNLFVFPEGTRSRNGTIGEFNSGAFKIARLCRKPIQVLYIRNSDKLFKPGRFLFNARSLHTITLTAVACIRPDYDTPGFSIAGVMNQARDILIAQHKNES
jgi:1-acyl-sn-glycerol-3-phosphate acyltransferase